MPGSGISAAWPLNGPLFGRQQRSKLAAVPANVQVAWKPPTITPSRDVMRPPYTVADRPPSRPLSWVDRSKLPSSAVPEVSDTSDRKVRVFAGLAGGKLANA